ncbi:hypothetical protein E2C01_063769 [Portunus trituberculatus]|uniref:Uncharacterized protein n=1 Tax=Portunus trituberculatus TaxID=210409 RepID=A0A5B7HA16_PORTR|nr:hypothetical protein [Portunus trituberculatus]
MASGEGEASDAGVELFDGYRPTPPVESCGTLVYDVYFSILSLPIFNSLLNQSAGSVHYMYFTPLPHILPGSIARDKNLNLKQPGPHRGDSSGNGSVQDDSSYTCEVDVSGEPSGIILVCFLLLFQLKAHGKELFWLWCWWCGCGVVGERVEVEGKVKEKERQE